MYSVRGSLLCLIVALASPLAAAEREFIHVTRNTQPRLQKEIQVTTETIGTLAKITVKLPLSEPRIISTSLQLGDGTTSQSLSEAAGKAASFSFVIPDWNLEGSSLMVAVGDPANGEAESFTQGKFYIVQPQQYFDLKAASASATPAGATPDAKSVRLSGESQAIAQLLAGVGEVDDRKVSLTERRAQFGKVVYATRDKSKFFNVHGNAYGVNPRGTIAFEGKQGVVKVRPGTAVLVELPRLTKTLKWLSAEAPEHPEVLGDKEIPVGFDHVLCWYEASGQVFWECYGPKPIPVEE